MIIKHTHSTLIQSDMNGTTTRHTVARTNKFNTLTLVDHGVILKIKKKEETTILFSELDKIYIKKHKLNFLNKIGFLSIMLILLYISTLYLPIEIVLFTAILFILLNAKINTFKWYQLKIFLNDGTFFNIVFYAEKKYEYINLVNSVRKKIFDETCSRLEKNYTPIFHFSN